MNSAMQKAEIKIEIAWLNMRRRAKEAAESITDPGRKGREEQIQVQRKIKAQ